MPRYIKICPRCGSTHVKLPPAGMDIKMVFKDFCEDCRFWGNFPEVKEDEVKSFKKKLKIK